MTMPADPSVDLATLDALFAAATPGEWTADGCFVETVEHPHVVVAECHEYEQHGVAPEPNAALIAALHNAWPELRRRLEIGDAAVAENAALRAEVERLEAAAEDSRWELRDALDRAYDA